MTVEQRVEKYLLLYGAKEGTYLARHYLSFWRVGEDGHKYWTEVVRKLGEAQ